MTRKTIAIPVLKTMDREKLYDEREKITRYFADVDNAVRLLAALREIMYQVNDGILYGNEEATEPTLGGVEYMLGTIHSKIGRERTKELTSLVMSRFELPTLQLADAGRK